MIGKALFLKELIKDEERAKKQNVGKILAGNVTQEFVLEKDFAEESGWTNFLKNGAVNWINFSTNKKITNHARING